MTPHERAVIEAASKWADAKHKQLCGHAGDRTFAELKDAECRLREAVSALRQAERKEVAT